MSPVRALVVCLGTGALLLLLVAPAQAHPSPWSTVRATVSDDGVVLDAEIPLDRYELASGESVRGTDAGLRDASAAIADDVRADVRVEVDGEPVPITVGSIALGRTQGAASLLLRLSATWEGRPADVTLTWLLVNREVPSHKAYLTRTGSGGQELVGVLTQAAPTARLVGNAEDPAAAGVGLGSMVGEGVHHIATGYDHLLFLTMLLLPAPALVRRRHAGRASLPATLRAVVGVVTAFTLGHSATLLLVSLGLLRLPVRPVETLVALSVVVAGAHAVRPVVPGGGRVVAALFGLVHGGAFATTILELDLGTADTLRAVLGFDLGIELAQLVVVAAVVPLLLLASASRDYRHLVATVATAGTVAALDWVAAIWTSGSPRFEPAFDLLAAHPVLAWGGLAAVAASMWAVRRTAAPPTGPPVSPREGRTARPSDQVRRSAPPTRHQALP